MIQWLQHIPFAMLQSVGLMALLFIFFNSIKWISIFKASFLFSLAVAFQLLGVLHFLYSLLYLPIPSHIIIVPSSFVNPNANWVFIIGILYCTILLGYFIRLTIQWRQMNELNRKADYKDSAFYQGLLPVHYGHIKIGIHNEITSPLTFGWWENIILLPLSLVNQLSQEEIKFILLHELAHIIRNDFLIQLIVETTHCILYFNPFSYYFIKEIGTQREMACDAWVVSKTNNTLAYTKILYQIAQSNKVANPFSLSALGSSSSELLLRIKKMHHVKIDSSSLFIKQISLAVMLFMLTATIQFDNKIHLSKRIVYHLTPIKNKQLPLVGLTNSKKRKQVTSQNKEIQSKELDQAVPNPTPTLDDYNKIVNETAQWIKLREDPLHYANFTTSNDSLDFAIAEKLVLRSVLKNYQLKKALLNEKLSTMQSSNEALEYLRNSKEWDEVLQYEKWTSTFLQKHPDALLKMDSLNRF